MNVTEAIKSALVMSKNLMTMYLKDFSDSDMLERPVPEANHPAWQLGHLISEEFRFMEGIKAGSSPKLPEGFAVCFSKANADKNESTEFHKKEFLLSHYEKQRNATIALLESLSESDLDAPSPEKIRPYFPTAGSVLLLTASHDAMHIGQIIVTRRKLQKPIII